MSVLQKIGWIADQMFQRHDPGPSHPESPARLRAIHDAIQARGLCEQLIPLSCTLASHHQLAGVHDPAYVDIVRMMCDEGFTFIGDRDTCISRPSYDVAALAAGGVLAACNAVMTGQVRRVFCAVRPPGHHAEPDQAMGYCLFNNVAVGAEHLLRHHHVRRLAIVDFDAHHGNGTQHIFEERSTVLYISLHERPGSLPFPGSGLESEIGRGPGVGYTVNIPLNPGAGEAEFLQAIQKRVIPELDQFRPEFILISAGFDALMRDNASHLSLVPASFGRITDPIVQVAQRHAGGRIVSVLEGGYDLADLGPAVVSHLEALLKPGMF